MIFLSSVWDSQILLVASVFVLINYNDAAYGSPIAVV